jgi:hypothetical protein
MARFFEGTQRTTGARHPLVVDVEDPIEIEDQRRRFG